MANKPLYKPNKGGKEGGVCAVESWNYSSNSKIGIRDLRTGEVYFSIPLHILPCDAISIIDRNGVEMIKYCYET